MEEKKKGEQFCNCLYYTSNALARVMTRIADEEFARTGLGSSHAFLLMVVSGKPGIQPKEISEHMMLTPSTITRLIEKLEQRGLLERKVQGKYTEVYATPKGLELNVEVKQAWQGLYRRYTSLLGEQVARELSTGLYEAVEKLEE